MLSLKYEYGSWKRSFGMNESGKRNRELMEAIVDALEAAMSGARKSHIMLKAKLNSAKANELIKHLISCELMRMEHPMYRTTEKGMKFMDLFREVEAMLHVNGSQLERNSAFFDWRSKLSPIQAWR